MPEKLKAGTVVLVHRDGYGFVAPGRLSGEDIVRFDPDSPLKVRFGRMTIHRPKMSNGDLELEPATDDCRIPVIGDTVLFYEERSSQGPRAKRWCYGDDAREVVHDYATVRPHRLVVQPRGRSGSVIVWEGSDLSEVVKYLPYDGEDRGEDPFPLNLERMQAWRDVGSNIAINTITQEVFRGMMSSGALARFMLRTKFGPWIPCRDLRYLNIW